MASLPLENYRRVAFDLHDANESNAPIRLNAGDIMGRRLQVAVTDNANALAAGTVTAKLLWNPDPDNPQSAGGYTTMTETSAGVFEVDVPRDLLLNAGSTPVIGVELDDGNGHIITSRNITAIVEPAVLRADAPAIADPLKDLHEAVANAAQAARDAADAVTRANTVLDGASIDAGSTSTLKPNESATAALAGTGLKRTLNLGLPRGAGIASVKLEENTIGAGLGGYPVVMVDAGAAPEVKTSTNTDGDVDIILHPNKPWSIALNAKPLPAGSAPSAADSTKTGETQTRTWTIGIPAGHVGLYASNAAITASSATNTVDSLTPAPAAASELEGARVVDNTGNLYDVTAVKWGSGLTPSTFTVGERVGSYQGAKGDKGDSGTLATQSTAGVVKGSTTIQIGADGAATVNTGALTKASKTVAGIVKVGDGLSVSDGTLSASTDTLSIGRMTVTSPTGLGGFMTLVGTSSVSDVSILVSLTSFNKLFNWLNIYGDPTTGKALLNINSMYSPLLGGGNITPAQLNFGGDSLSIGTAVVSSDGSVSVQSVNVSVTSDKKLQMMWTAGKTGDKFYPFAGSWDIYLTEDKSASSGTGDEPGGGDAAVDPNGNPIPVPKKWNVTFGEPPEGAQE